MVWALILAAGESKRMGSPKLLLPFESKTLIETVVSNTIRSEVDKTLIVLGCNAEKIADKIGICRPFYTDIKNGKKNVGPKFINGATQFILTEVNGGSSSVVVSANNNGERSSIIKRTTEETDISLELNIDGSGKSEINNGIGMFDHLLAQVAKHGKFDIKLSAVGDDQHHLVEDVAICLGQAFGKALGEKRGIVRMAEATVPMDEALATAIIDISGRGYAVLDIPLTGNDMSGFPADLVRHFLESFANEARLNLHARVIYGSSDHHKVEALFKALGRALDMATRIDERISGELPTTKGAL